MKKMMWVGLLLICALIALVVQMPARLVDHAIVSASNNQIRLINATGTLWRGAGDLVFADSGQNLISGIHWSLDPRPLFGLRAAGQVWQEGVSPATPGTFSLGREELILQRVDLNFQAAALLPLIQASGWEPRGNLQLRTQDLRRSAQETDGEFTITWRGAALVAGDNTLSLGDVHIPCSAKGPLTDCTIDNQGGDLGLQGRGIFKSGGGWDFNAEVRPRDSLPPPLAALLRQVGQPGSNGSIKFAYSSFAH